MLMQSKNPLENELFRSVYEKTPNYIKNLNIMDFSNKGEFTFILKKEHLKPYDEKTNPQGLNLEEWFCGYAKEAKVSTAGIEDDTPVVFKITLSNPLIVLTFLIPVKLIFIG